MLCLLTKSLAMDSFAFRSKLASISDQIDKDSLEKLTFILIPESGVKEKIQSFLELVEVLYQRHPRDYKSKLTNACKDIKRNDIADELESFVSIGRGLFMQEKSYDISRDLQVVSINDRTDLEMFEIDGSDSTSKIEIRNYQKELATPAINRQNCIICAPTGSGKTITVGYICKALLEKNPGMKIIFLVPIRSLAKQQADLLTKILGSRVLNNPDIFLNEMLINHSVVVSTHQVLLNELEAKRISLEYLDLIVFDECHHTKLKHPYNQIMNYYHIIKKDVNANCRLPQIIGLTASLGTDNSFDEDGILRHFASLCARLDGSITIVRDPSNKRELLEYNRKPGKEQIIVCKLRENPNFYQKLSYLMLGLERDYNIPTIPIKGNLEYQNKIIEMRKNYESQEGTVDEILVCQVLKILNDALMFFDDSIEEYTTKFVKKELKFLDKNENQKKLHEKILKCFEELKMECHDRSWKSNQKLVKLCNLLEDLSTINATCIMLTRTCRNVDFLFDFLNGLPHLREKLNILKIVGQSNEEYGMAETQQTQTISHSRNIAGQKCTLLIATDVIQEGVDLPKCNSVIRYNFVSNEIGTVQSRGRARAPDSQIYLIVDEGSINLEREYENLLRERKMVEVLDSLSHKQKHFEHLVDKAKETHMNSMELEIKQRETSKEFDSRNVNIYCKTCKVKICSGDEIKKYPAGYIITGHHLEDVADFKPWDATKSFKDDSHLGDMDCKKCKMKLATKIMLKRLNNYAYILIKDSLSWKSETRSAYQSMPKKWRDLHFDVETYSA